MTNKTYIQNKIRTYNFAEAKFETLPPEMFSVDPKTLSSMERAILEGIIYQKNISIYIEGYQIINYSIKYHVSGIRQILRSTADSLQLEYQKSLIGNLDLGIGNYLEIRSIRLIRNFLPVTFFSSLVTFLMVSLAYYANINLNLGMDFLTEFFA